MVKHWQEVGSLSHIRCRARVNRDKDWSQFKSKHWGTGLTLEKDKFSSDQFVISIDTVNLHKVNWFTATLRYFETLEEFSRFSLSQPGCFWIPLYFTCTCPKTHTMRCNMVSHWVCTLYIWRLFKHNPFL